MPGEHQTFRPSRPIPTFAIFNLIRRKYSYEILRKCRRIETVSLSIARTYCHLRFNHSSKDEALLPISLQFSSPIQTSRGYKLIRKQGFEFLRLRITECHLKILGLKSEKRKLVQDIQNSLSEDDMLSLTDHLKQSEIRTKNVTSTSRRVARNSQWGGAILGVWGRSPQPPEANGGLGAKPPATGGWGFGGKAPSRRRHGGLGAEPPALENFAFFCKNNFILGLF